jgi:hypothetical protein
VLDVDLRGILELERFLESCPEVTIKAASISMNEVLSGKGLATYRKATAAELNFPHGYVDERINVEKRATTSDLTASIVGRQRPTSLARFSPSKTVGKSGVTVRVKDKTKTFKDGFLVRLRKGASISDDGYNLGLAVRLKEGVTLNKKDQSRMVHLEKDVVLLYGPSVDQVLRNEVAEKKTPEVVDDIATEFFRQFQRLSHG